MIRFIFFLVLSLLITVQAYATDTAVTVGAGSVSCGYWIEVRSQTSLHHQLRQWVFGFISGFNWYTEGRQAIAQDQAAVVAFIDQYCKNNPLDSLSLAAAAIVQETGGQKVHPLHQWKR
jgi:hypothetical protein